MDYQVTSNKLQKGEDGRDDKLSTVKVSIVKDSSRKDALEVTNMVLSTQNRSDKKEYTKLS